MESPEREVRILVSAAVMGDHKVVKTVPLADGDPAWVFPGQEDAWALMASLTASGGRMAEIGRLLRVGQAGAAVRGLEYVIYPGLSRRRLWGYAENSQVTFEVEAVPAGGSDGDPASWEVRAEVSVRCDARYDASCGTHVIEELPVADCATAEETAAAVDRATAWLLARCRAVPPAEWRTREPLRPCQGGHD